MAMVYIQIMPAAKNNRFAPAAPIVLGTPNGLNRSAVLVLDANGRTRIETRPVAKR